MNGILPGFTRRDLLVIAHTLIIVGQYRENVKLLQQGVILEPIISSSVWIAVMPATLQLQPGNGLRNRLLYRGLDIDTGA